MPFCVYKPLALGELMLKNHKLQLSALLSLLLVVFAVAPATYAQDYFGGTDPDAPFSFSLEGFGDDLSFGALADKTLSVNAQIVKAPESVADVWNDEGAAPVGFLAVQTTVADTWHIYTPTQTGGMATKFDKLEISSPDVELGEVYLATEWKLVKDDFGDETQELFGKVDWIAPIYAPEGVEIAELSISGVVNAIACCYDEGGTCVPQKEEFSAKFAEKDVADVLSAAEKLMLKTGENNLKETGENVSETGETSSANLGTPTAYNAKRIIILLITAFLGGLILNVTPCVLPVVGLKILSFFEQAGRSRASAFMLNVWYTLGVLIVFAVLAFFVSGLSSLFTRGLFQILMSAIVFVMALSLMGVWELQAPAFLGGEKSSELSSKEGPAGAVFKGVITTLLAIPCGAPLLSPTLNWASQQPLKIVFFVYLVIGLGMASPFLIAGAFPELLKFFPKPGEWMDTFRKVMGYFLLIAVLWILYSAPLEYLLPSITCLFALWFACWNIGRNQWEFENPKKKIKGWIVSIVVVAVTIIFSFNFPGNPIKTNLQNASSAKLLRWAIRAERDGKLEEQKKGHWALFDKETFARELEQGRIVAVDFTADWCVNCKFIERTLLHTEEIEKKFEEKNVLTLTADWTNQDAQTPDVIAINELLDANGARQVPTLMIFTPENPDKPIVLSGLYTKSTLVEAIDSL